MSPSSQINTAADQLTAQECTPIMTAADTMVRDDASGIKEVQPPKGSQPFFQRSVGSGQTQAVNGGMEFVLLLRYIDVFVFVVIVTQPIIV